MTGGIGYIVSPSFEIKIGSDSGHVGGKIARMVPVGDIVVGLEDGKVVGVAVGLAEGEEVGLALGLVLSVGDSDGAELGK